MGRMYEGEVLLSAFCFLLPAFTRSSSLTHSFRQCRITKFDLHVYNYEFRDFGPMEFEECFRTVAVEMVC